MIGKLIDFIIGKVSFEISVNDGRDMTVLNLLKENGLYSCSIFQGKVVFSCGCISAKKVSETLDRLGVPYSSKITGLLSYVKRLFFRPGLAMGALLCVFLNFILCGTLWKIDVVGNENIETFEIMNKLEHFGVREGCRVKGIDIKKLSRDYMLSDNRLSFVHMNIKGTKAIVEVAEATPKGEVENAEKDKKEVCNIVAKCDGVITRLDVYSGGREVENGQSVVEGQLLISSFFETRTAGYLLRRARGTAFANTSPVFEMWVPKSVYKKKSEKVHTKNLLSFAGQTISINGFLPENGRGTVRLETEEKEPHLFGFLSLPCRLIEKNYIVTEYERAELSHDEAKELFDESFEKWKKSFETDSRIMSSETESYEKDGYYVFVGKLSCIESIGIDKPFEIRAN